jgi:predicted membrane protein
MHVVECDVPSSSMLNRDLIASCYFHDSYRMPLTRAELGIVDIFFALFGHTPLWTKMLLIVRNAIAKLVGLEAPTVAEIMNPDIRSDYSVGEKIGPWPIFFIDDSEIVAGRNNKHLDFRVSVLKMADGEKMNVVISTICTVHNLFGKIYLLVIVPFHRHGVKSLMRNALAAERL